VVVVTVFVVHAAITAKEATIDTPRIAEIARMLRPLRNEEGDEY
jgi:hypothetical protein